MAKMLCIRKSDPCLGHEFIHFLMPWAPKYDDHILCFYKDKMLIIVNIYYNFISYIFYLFVYVFL